MFNAFVTLQSSTQGVVFIGSAPLVNRSGSVAYPGGSAVLSSCGAAFSQFTAGANFELVALPASIPVLGTLFGLATGRMAIAALRRKINAV